MKKLIHGIVEFRKKLRPEYRDTFARQALGQSPDTLMIACSDSRVVPNLFASADPGDLFVVRNVGNLVAPCGTDGRSVGDESEPAAIEFALQVMGVTDLILCGHSDCGAIKAVQEESPRLDPPHLRSWLSHARPALERWKKGEWRPAGLTPLNQLTQLNVLQQLEHLRTYDVVNERVQSGRLRLHGWWFDIGKADVYAYEESANAFALIDDRLAEKILKRLEY